MSRIALLIAALAIAGVVTEASAQGRRTCTTYCSGSYCTTNCY